MICLVRDATGDKVCFVKATGRADGDIGALCAAGEFTMVKGVPVEFLPVGNDVWEIHRVEHVATGARRRVVSKKLPANAKLVQDAEGKAIYRLVHDQKLGISYISMRVEKQADKTLVKGTIEPNENITKACKREMLEEAGLLPDYVKYIKRVELTPYEARNGQNKERAVLIYELTEAGRKQRDHLNPTDSFESEGVEWVRIRDLYKGNRVSDSGQFKGFSAWVLGLEGVRAYLGIYVQHSHKRPRW